MLVGQGIKSKPKKDKAPILKKRVDALLEIVEANEKVKGPVFAAGQKARQKAITAVLRGRKNKQFEVALGELVEKIRRGEM